MKKIGVDRGVDFVSGGTNYLISPSNDNKNKDLKGFTQEGFKNALTGGATSSGTWSEQTSSAAIRQVVPEHLQGVEVSRRDFILGDLPAPPSVSGGDGQGYDQRRQ